MALLAAGAAAERRFDTQGDTELIVGTLEGDLASQHAVESELAREGLDRTVLGRDAFVERVRETEARRRTELGDALAETGIVVDIEAGRTATEACAARGAHRVRASVRRRTVRARRTRRGRVHALPDRDRAHRRVVSADRRRALHAAGGDGGDGPPVEVALIELELLPGVVAVAVPTGHPAAGATVRVPLGRDVPVIASDDVDAPWFVVPAHTSGRAGLRSATTISCRCPSSTMPAW